MPVLFKWCRFVVYGGIIMSVSGSCLPDNFWAGLLGDTIVSGATVAVVDAVMAGVLPQ